MTEFLPGGTVDPNNPLPIPSPMPRIAQSANTVNIMLLGSDTNTLADGFRTDVIIIVSVNPDLPSVSMLSIPRDFYAWIPGYGFNKINTAWLYGRGWPGGGAESLKNTIEYNFGIPIHYYARVGFDSFAQIVDAIGGIDVPVECELHDTFPDPSVEAGQSDIDVYPGMVHLEGKYALWYARSRWSTSDFDRNRRQQQVLRSVYHKVKTSDIIPRIPELWSAITQAVDTDLQLDDAIWLGWIGSQIDLDRVKSRSVAPPTVRSWTAPNGGAVQVPIYENLQPVVEEAMQPPAGARASQPATPVELLNGGVRQDWVEVAYERLRWEGYRVVSVSTADTAYPRTQIVDFATSGKGSAMAGLMRLYNRQAGDVVSQPTEGSPVAARIILGQDYDPCWATRQRWYVMPAITPTALPPATLWLTPTPVPPPAAP